MFNVIGKTGKLPLCGTKRNVQFSGDKDSRASGILLYKIKNSARPTRTAPLLLQRMAVVH